MLRTKSANRVFGGVAMLAATGVAAALAAVALGKLGNTGNTGDPPSIPQAIEAPRAQGLRLSIAPTIVAVPSSQTPLQILVESRDEVSANSFLNISGLPPAILLSVGRAIGPGEWVVPSSLLANVTMSVPADVSGRFELVVVLLSGGDEIRPTFAAQARATLVVASLGASIALGQEPLDVASVEN